MSSFWTERTAHISQPFFLNLRDTPHRVIIEFVGVEDVGVAFPVEAARVRNGAPKRIAMPPNVFGQRING